MRRLVLAMAMATGGLIAGELVVGAAPDGAGPNWTWLIVTEGPAAADEREALVRALRLLPALPARVAVLDAEQARPDVKPTLLRLDAFVIRGRAEVYVVRQSGLLKCAMRRAPPCTHALAAVESVHPRSAGRRRGRTSLPERAGQPPGRLPARTAMTSVVSPRGRRS
jgi:hypothetical protein